MEGYTGVDRIRGRCRRFINWDWVIRVIKLRQNSVKDGEIIRVSYREDESCSGDIVSVIDLAIKKKKKKRVKRIEIDASVDGIGTKKSWSGFQDKTSAYMKSPCGISSIEYLTHLSLKSVDISGECLEHFLLQSPLLEHLCVEDSASLVNFKVYGYSLRLKLLQISWCYQLERVEIIAPKLKSFFYYGTCGRTWLSIEYAPSLVELSLGPSYGYENHNLAIRTFLSYFSQLKTLTLSISAGIRLKDFPKLISLKNLTLEAHTCMRDCQEALLDWTAWVKSSPFLERLALKLKGRFSSSWRTRHICKVKCPHQCLKVVEFSGYVGGAVDYELALYFIENAVALKKIIFPQLSASPAFPANDFAAELKKELHKSRSKAILEII